MTRDFRYCLQNLPVCDIARCQLLGNHFLALLDIGVAVLTEGQRPGQKKQRNEHKGLRSKAYSRFHADTLDGPLKLLSFKNTEKSTRPTSSL
jgi:hypothetical protein